MKREQRTIQVRKVLWTYKESPTGPDGDAGNSEIPYNES